VKKLRELKKDVARMKTIAFRDGSSVGTGKAAEEGGCEPRVSGGDPSEARESHRRQEEVRRSQAMATRR
jgi:hypothetical protein